MTEPTPQPPSSLPPSELAAAQPVAVVAAPAPAPAAPRPAPAKSSESSMAGIIDTVEAILIALILALTFRAFVVEAFVIPTGSMAPTLLGAHFNVICPKCGYHFAADADLHYQFGLDERSRQLGILAFDRGELTSNRNIPCDSLPTDCPNCSYAIDPQHLPQYLFAQNVDFDQRNNRGLNRVEFAWANNGDRILVLKYLYSILEPQRWDVIVFKEPMSARDNYIKRLIALPNETVEIINGDVFIAPPEKRPQPGREIDPRDLQIARKPAYIQEALWQLVYDNDYYPIAAKLFAEDANPWTNPWIADPATPTARAWEIRGPGINYTANTAGKALFSVRDPYTLNTLGYNRDTGESFEVSDVRRVGDLRLECTWIPKEKSAESLTLVLGLPRNQYKVVWDFGGLELLRHNPATGRFESVIRRTGGEVPVPIAGQGYHVALNNVDRSVQFFIDGKMVLEHITPWTAADARKEMAEIEQTREFVTSKPDISVKVGGACTIAHLKVMRDLYYTQAPVWAQPHSRARSGDPGTATANNPLTLDAEEYFAMGDNSRKSHDGRRWAEVYSALDDIGTRRGIVPQRYLLGKAFFVYWPAGYRPHDKVPVPIVPNAGDMRFIR